MKTVWVLGAGASIGHSEGAFPSINDFFLKGKELQITCGKKGNVHPDFEKVNKYIKGLTGKYMNEKKPTINIEDILTFLEIDIERSNDFSLTYTKDKIISLIRNVLYQLSSETDIYKGEYCLFKDMLEIHDTILTFNWDLLLDENLGRSTTLPENLGHINTNNEAHYYNFIMELTAIKLGTWGGIGPNRPYRKYETEKGYYIKLHGSIDWLYCSNKSCDGYAKVYPVSQFIHPHYCGECHEEMTNLIIPPVLNKKYSTYPFIRTLWNKAAQELQKARRVVIWGYSLPPTDFYSNWLLRHARKNIKELIIINPECVSDKYWNNGFIIKFIDVLGIGLTPNSVKGYYDFSDFKKDLQAHLSPKTLLDDDEQNTLYNSLIYRRPGDPTYNKLNGDD